MSDNRRILLDQTLSEFAQVYRISDLSLDSYGTAGLELKDGTSLHFEYHRDATVLVVYTGLVSLSTDVETRLKICESALRMNCTGQLGERIHIAISNTDELIAQTMIEITGLDGKSLGSLLDKLLSVRVEILAQLFPVSTGPAAIQESSPSDAHLPSMLLNLI